MTTPQLTETAKQLANFRGYLSNRSKIGEATKTRYFYEVQRFFKDLNQKAVASITRADILAWGADMQKNHQASGTIGLRVAGVASFFDYLEFWEEDEHAGALLRALKRLERHEGGKPRRETYALSEEEVQRLLATAGAHIGVGPRDRALFYFLWSAACRRIEAQRLQLEDLDVAGHRARVFGKGNKWRTVAFDAGCEQALTKWLETRAGWPNADTVSEVFVTVMGTALHVNTISTIVRVTGQEAGLDKAVWTHLFRHTRLTELADQGYSLLDTSHFAGHQNIQTTMGYYHTDETEALARYDEVARGKPRAGSG